MPEEKVRIPMSGVKRETPPESQSEAPQETEKKGISPFTLGTGIVLASAAALVGFEVVKRRKKAGEEQQGQPAVHQVRPRPKLDAPAPRPTVRRRPVEEPRPARPADPAKPKGSSKRGSSDYNRFVAERIPEYRDKGASPKEAMRRAAKDWNKKG